MRKMVRRVAPLLLAVALLLGSSTRTTFAARGWCQADPVIMVDGQLADVFVSSDLSMLLSASGPIQLVVTIPEGSSGALVLADLGFGYGYKVSFVHSASLSRTSGHTQVRVSAYAPAKSSLGVQVNFAPRALNSGLMAILIGQTAEGVANNWVTLTTS